MHFTPEYLADHPDLLDHYRDIDFKCNCGCYANMTVGLAAGLRADLENRIYGLVGKYESLTGLAVTAIDL